MTKEEFKICECGHDHLELEWGIKEGKEVGTVVKRIECTNYDCECKDFKK